MSELAFLLLATALVVVLSLLASAAVAKLARLDGASYPGALIQAVSAFIALMMLAAALTSALVDVVT
ncbi:hypothetical protein [Streptomyces virginiae]|uniref:hypothetical protein n=1 Tax=Streptomyces virginiae TaxID=1961 RepID=UPI00370074D1